MLATNNNNNNSSKYFRNSISIKLNFYNISTEVNQHKKIKMMNGKNFFKKLIMEKKKKKNLI